MKVLPEGNENLRRHWNKEEVLATTERNPTGASKPWEVLLRVVLPSPEADHCQSLSEERSPQELFNLELGAEEREGEERVPSS